MGPILAGVINTHLGWKWNFYINGCLTLAITILWVILIKDTPQENASISPEELQFILSNIIVEEPNETVPKIPPYQKIFLSIKVWALVREWMIQTTGFTVHDSIHFRWCLFPLIGWVTISSFWGFPYT